MCLPATVWAVMRSKARGPQRTIDGENRMCLSRSTCCIGHADLTGAKCSAILHATESGKLPKSGTPAAQESTGRLVTAVGYHSLGVGLPSTAVG